MAKAKKPTCKCIEKVDAKLAEFNTSLCKTLSLNFSTGDAATHLTVATKKIDPKKRGKAKTVFMTYCPFCGIQLTT